MLPVASLLSKEVVTEIMFFHDGSEATGLTLRLFMLTYYFILHLKRILSHLNAKKCQQWRCLLPYLHCNLSVVDSKESKFVLTSRMSYSIN